MAIRPRIIRILALITCFVAGLSCEPRPPAQADQPDAPKAQSSVLAQGTALAPGQDHPEAPIDSLPQIDTLPLLDSIPLDSCTRLDTAARPQNRVPQPGEVDPPPAGGNWTETVEVHDSLGRLAVPKSAIVSYRPNGHYSLSVGGMPGCRYSCGVSVTYVTVAPRPAVSPPANPDEDDWQPGPPRPIVMGSDHGELREVPCGDCNSAEIVLSRGQRRAVLEFSLDDREGYQPGIMCRLARVASSYRWSEEPDSR
jgi:hypothetical protein